MSIQLQGYCEENGIEAEFIETEKNTRSAQDAAKVLQVQPHQIIKSLMFYVDEEPFLVIVRGPDRVDEEELKALLEAEAARLADPEEVEDATGYSVGGVPPVSVDLPKVVDEDVLHYDTVYGGGGSENEMIGLDPRFIVGENDVVGDVTES